MTGSVTGERAGTILISSKVHFSHQQWPTKKAHGKNSQAKSGKKPRQWQWVAFPFTAQRQWQGTSCQRNSGVHLFQNMLLGIASCHLKAGTSSCTHFLGCESDENWKAYWGVGLQGSGGAPFWNIFVFRLFDCKNSSLGISFPADLLTCYISGQELPWLASFVSSHHWQRTLPATSTFRMKSPRHSHFWTKACWY